MEPSPLSLLSYNILPLYDFRALNGKYSKVEPVLPPSSASTHALGPVSQVQQNVDQKTITPLFYPWQRPSRKIPGGSKYFVSYPPKSRKSYAMSDEAVGAMIRSLDYDVEGFALQLAAYDEFSFHYAYAIMAAYISDLSMFNNFVHKSISLDNLLKNLAEVLREPGADKERICFSRFHMLKFLHVVDSYGIYLPEAFREHLKSQIRIHIILLNMSHRASWLPF